LRHEHLALGKLACEANGSHAVSDQRQAEAAPFSGERRKYVRRETDVDFDEVVPVGLARPTMALASAGVLMTKPSSSVDPSTKKLV
jgi:hypothetical protein